MTIAPELPGALELITWLAAHGVAVSIGHSAATVAEARAGYEAGATTTTHLFNAMCGVDHHTPGLALAALLDDEVFTELIADGVHVDRALWPLITRLKRSDRLLAVSDAISLAGTGEVAAASARSRSRFMVIGHAGGYFDARRLGLLARRRRPQPRRFGVPLPDAVAAASRNPVALLGVSDRGRIAPGLRADLVELAPDLSVTRVMRAGVWQQ